MTSLFNCCCCRCTCSQDSWDDLGDSFSYSHNVDTATVTLTKITDDGTTLACTHYIQSPDPTGGTVTGDWNDTTVVSRKSPCLEVDADIRWSDPAISGTTPCEYIFGRIYTDCAFTPNGYNQLVQFRLDSTFRYNRTAYTIFLASDGSVLETPDTVAVNADATPTVGGYNVQQQFAPSFCVKQGDRIYFLKHQSPFDSSNPNHVVTKRIEGTTGRDIDDVFLGSPTPSSGNTVTDWLRCITSSALGEYLSQYFPIVAGNSALQWYTWDDPSTPQDNAYRTDLQPDLCDTENPIYFGWYWRLFAIHQYGYLDQAPPESPTNPRKNSRSTITHWRSRIDALCVNIADGTEFLDCPELSVCCDPPPETITVSVDVAGSGTCYGGAGTFTLPRVPAGGVEARWAGDDDTSTAWLISCSGEVWRAVSPDNNFTVTGATSASCDPFEIVFTKTTGSCIGTVVTVTV